MPDFFSQPILNSPYDAPSRHWELDADGKPTNKIIERRRRAEFVSATPGANPTQDHLDLEPGLGGYELQTEINELRAEVDRWRALPNPADWRVTPETERLLKHWRDPDFDGLGPFFCQVEAAEVAIWLAEVAPKSGARWRRFLERLGAVNDAHNPELFRLALKLATGAGKTTVMALLIAWQTLNAVRRPGSKAFTKGFLLVAPGVTIRDRLRVLQPNDPESYYKECKLVPSDMLQDLNQAKIVITNYHAFRRRERVQLSSGGREALMGGRVAVKAINHLGDEVMKVFEV